MPAMTARERLRAAIRGEQTDRPPWSLWRHFYQAESTAEQLADQMLAWVRRYPLDFLKVNPRAQYHVEPWGARYRYRGGEHDRPERLAYPVKSAVDLEQLEVRGLDDPALSEQLRALRQIEAKLDGGVPFVETVFSPLGVAGYLVEDNQTLVRLIREQPAAVHAALDTIARTFAPFTAACLEAGADGLFFATTRWASRDYLTPAEYAEFGRPYDLRVLESARGAPFNILHVCDGNNMLLDLADYPVQAFNWAATDATNPSVVEAAVPGPKIGGLSGESLTAPDAAEAAREAAGLRAAAGSGGWALGPNCSIPTTARDENIRAAGRAENIRAAGRAIGVDL
jgi:uroporphyrinogen decarboxylase